MTGWPDFTPPPTTENGGWGAPSPGSEPAVADDPTPSPVSPKTEKASRRMRLHTVNDVKRELRRLYVEARNGTIKSADATKLAYLLNMLANLMVDSDLEDRVNAALGEGGGK